jgi:hypothetical protein
MIFFSNRTAENTQFIFTMFISGRKPKLFMGFNCNGYKIIRRGKRLNLSVECLLYLIANLLYGCGFCDNYCVVKVI